MTGPDYFGLDVETLPAIDTDPADTVCKLPKEPERPVLREVAGNVKKDATKAAHKAKHAEAYRLALEAYGPAKAAWLAECDEARREKWRKASVHPLKARLLCISGAFCDEEPWTLYADYHLGPLTTERCDSHEGLLLERFADKMRRHPAPHTWRGHNLAFDLTMIMLRAARYRIPIVLPKRRRYSDDVYDTLDEVQGYMRWDGAKLDAIAEFLRIPGKPDGVDGSKVYQMWLEGRHDEIRRYCAGDVEMPRAIANVLP